MEKDAYPPRHEEHQNRSQGVKSSKIPGFLGGVVEDFVMSSGLCG
jgi:hypothetical protein